MAFADASHNAQELEGNFNCELTDNIHHYQYRFKSEHIAFERRQLLESADAVIVNGNHFKAEKQLVIINEAKKESLQRKLDRLTHVIGFVLDEGQENIHEYLKEHYSGLPVLAITDVDDIAKLMRKEIRLPQIKGLVLAGGRSTRMGEDKGEIVYHNQPQRDHMAGLLNNYCAETFLSVADEKLSSEYLQIKDSFAGLGPMGGILSAFRQDPDSAWLVVATDIPLLDKENHCNPTG